MDDVRVRSALDDLVADPPPSTVDVGAAAAAGRRRQAWQRWGTATAGALTVGAVVAGVALGVPALGGDRQPVPGPQMVSAAGTEWSTVAMPRRFDPAVQYGAFGWLPDGLDNRLTQGNPDSFTIEARNEPLSEEPPEAKVALELAPSGKRDWKPAGTRVEVPSVDGSAARAAWLTTSGRVAHLTWLYAPDAWAKLSVWDSRPGAAPAKDLAVRIAGALSFSAERKVPLPIRPTTVPASLPLQSLSVSVSPGRSPRAWSARLEYSDNAERVIATKDGRGRISHLLVVEAHQNSTRTGDGKKIWPPDTMLDGHPARFAANGEVGGESLAVFDVQGAYISVWTSNATIQGRLPSGGVKAMFRALQIYTRPADWR